MVLNITDEMRKKYEENLKKAEPYSDKEISELQLDGEMDIDRYNATFAKKILDAEKNPNIKCQRDIFR